MVKIKEINVNFKLNQYINMPLEFETKFSICQFNRYGLGPRSNCLISWKFKSLKSNILLTDTQLKILITFKTEVTLGKEQVKKKSLRQLRQGLGKNGVELQ